MPRTQRRQGQPGACRRRLGVVHHLHAAELAARRQAHRSSPIAAPARRSTTSSADRSTTCATRSSTWSSRSRPAPSRPMPSPRPSARRRCRTCRPPRRPGCRTTRSAPGTRCSRPRARRRRSSPSSTRRWCKALDDETTAQAPARPRQRAAGQGRARSPEALQKLVESEVARWTPILKGDGGAVGCTIVIPGRERELANPESRHAP